MKADHRAVVALNLSKHVHDVIASAKAIVAAMTKNAALPAPHPKLTTVAGHVAELEAAETVALTHAKGAAEARNVKLAVVLADIHELKSYVQAVADADHENAHAIIESAHMSVKRPGSRTKNDFEVKQGNLSGTAILIAKAAGARASNQWEQSADGGKTWTVLPATLQAHSAALGLTPAQTYAFRHRAVTKAGEGDWSQIATLLVK